MKILIINALFLCTFWIPKAIDGNENQETVTKVIAHRGAWKKYGLPQNSIASLRKAIESKFDGSEFDVRITKDDSLIIIHDPVHHGLKVEESTYEALIQYTLANGERLPTLREYLIHGLENNPATKLVLEIKPSENGTEKGQYIAEKAIEVVTELNAAEKIMYISFDFQILKKIKSINPQASVHYLEGNKSPREIHENNISGINYHFSRYKTDSTYFSEAKKYKIKLNSWTVNDPKIMDWLLQNSMDYITTDEPELLAEKISKK